MITLEQIKQLIQVNIDREKLGIKYHTIIAEVLKKYDGKQITKRIATELEKQLPEDYVFYNTNYGMFHIDIWINKSRDNSQSHLIGYASNPYVNLDQFVNHFDMCYGIAAIKRNDSRLSLLNDNLKLQTIVTLINNLNSAITEYETIVNHRDIEDYYAINKLVIKE